MSFERVARLDPHRAIDIIEARTGIRLAIDALAAGGEVGAAYVRWPDGHPSVLNIGWPGAAPLLERVRAAGVPAPVYELTVDDGPLTYLVQSLLPGAAPETVDRPLVDQMIAINERFAGLLADRSDLPPLPLFLLADGPGFCLHEPLARYDRRTARLLAWIHAVGADRDDADGDDLVHVDFHTGNVLVEANRVTGVVDWDGAGRGDRRLGLVTLRFDLAHRAPHLTAWLDDLLATVIPPDRRRAYLAHMSLRQVDWSIRHHTAHDVEFWLDAIEPIVD